MSDKGSVKIQAKLPPKVAEMRNEIKLLISSITGIPYGRVNDHKVIAKAIEVYYEKLVKNGEIDLPEGWEPKNKQS